MLDRHSNSCRDVPYHSDVRQQGGIRGLGFDELERVTIASKVVTCIQIYTYYMNSEIEYFERR